MSAIRRCRDGDRAAILAIVNAAAEAYRGVIPADRWHEPYMPADELDREIAAGVVFWGYEQDGTLTGVMGLQAARDVDLIRHAYVLPGSQRRGIGVSAPEPLYVLATDASANTVTVGPRAELAARTVRVRDAVLHRGGDRCLHRSRTQSCAGCCDRLDVCRHGGRGERRGGCCGTRWACDDRCDQRVGGRRDVGGRCRTRR